VNQNRINIAIVGLGFGKEFIPIYQKHPNTNMYAICQRTPEKLNEIGDQYKTAERYNEFEPLIQDPNVDAVHINSPIHLHAPQSIAALKAGKHVACTVPAATSIQDCRDIVNAANAAHKNYMMMETAIYTREFLFVRELRDTGKLGRVQFMRGAHQQRCVAGLDIGKGYRRCTMRRTPSVPVSPSCAVKPISCRALVQAESRTGW
jgi:predicted dehydrogenase